MTRRQHKFLRLERATIAEWQGASEDQKFVAKPTQSNMTLFFTNGITLMLWQALSLLIIITGNLFSSDFEFEGELRFEKKPLFVSLGSHCDVALSLRNCGLRKAAFPFDWLEMRNHDRFIMLLDEDFRRFLGEQFFNQHLIDPIFVENFYYEIGFYHEWPFSDYWTDESRYQQQLQEIRTKYSRRIERFRQLRQFPGKVFFVCCFNWDRHGLEKRRALNAEHAKKLNDALRRYFPLLNFTLVIVNYIDSNVPAIENIEGVLEYQITKTKDLEEYEAVYQDLLKNLSQ